MGTPSSCSTVECQWRSKCQVTRLMPSFLAVGRITCSSKLSSQLGFLSMCPVDLRSCPADRPSLSSPPELPSRPFHVQEGSRLAGHDGQVQLQGFLDPGLFALSDIGSDG